MVARNFGTKRKIYDLRPSITELFAKCLILNDYLIVYILFEYKTLVYLTGALIVYAKACIIQR